MKIYCHESGLYNQHQQFFDVVTLTWRVGSLAPNLPAMETMQELTLEEACIWQQQQKQRIRPPVAVIGPREATQEQLHVAYEVGKDLARLGLTVICGGRQGVMEWCCHGVADGGGISVGLLPEGDFTAANPYVTVPVATGIGIARNALISRSALALVAIGGGLGTISEIALALQFEKTVFTVCGAPQIEGAQSYASWQELKQGLLSFIFSNKEQ